MSIFYVNFKNLSDVITNYESLLTQLDVFDEALATTISEVNEEAYAGIDAVIVRNGWNTCANESVPKAIEQITAIKDTLIDARTEFKECKKYCVNFANAFGINTGMIHLSGMSGALKCDYDGILLSADEYCENIIDECIDMNNIIVEAKTLFNNLKLGSYDEIYEMIEEVQNEIVEISETISKHKSDLHIYAGMVKSADESLNRSLKEILSEDPKYFAKLGSSLPDYLFNMSTLDQKNDFKSPEYIYCVTCLERGEVNYNNLDEYNMCLESVLKGNDRDYFLNYLEKKCYSIELDDYNSIFASTLYTVGCYVNESKDEDTIQAYREVNQYLSKDLGVVNNPLSTIRRLNPHYKNAYSEGESYDRDDDKLANLMSLNPMMEEVNKEYIKNVLNGNFRMDFDSTFTDKRVLDVMDAGSAFSTLSKDEIDEIYTLNCEGWENYLNDKNSLGSLYHPADSRGVVFIDDQTSINGDDSSPHSYTMYYGKKNISSIILTDDVNINNENGYIYGSANMCEAIATQNAISDHNGSNAYFPKILKDYSQMNLVLDGNGGTSPYDIELYLNSNGIDTVFYIASDMTDEDYKYLYENCDGVIFTAWNGPKPMDAIHTMYISIDESKFSPSGYVCVRHNDSGEPGMHSTTSRQNGALKNLIENYSDIPDGAISVIGVISNEK